MNLRLEGATPDSWHNQSLSRGARISLHSPGGTDIRRPPPVPTTREARVCRGGEYAPGAAADWMSWLSGERLRHRRQPGGAASPGSSQNRANGVLSVRRRHPVSAARRRRPCVWAVIHLREWVCPRGTLGLGGVDGHGAERPGG